MLLIIYVVNEQKQEIVDFIRNSDGTVRVFKDENEVHSFGNHLFYDFKFTAYVFDVKEGEIIHWFS